MQQGTSCKLLQFLKQFGIWGIASSVICFSPTCMAGKIWLPLNHLSLICFFWGTFIFGIFCLIFNLKHVIWFLRFRFLPICPLKHDDLDGFSAEGMRPFLIIRNPYAHLDLLFVIAFHAIEMGYSLWIYRLWFMLIHNYI